jgi:hypothetical protein
MGVFTRNTKIQSDDKFCVGHQKVKRINFRPTDPVLSDDKWAILTKHQIGHFCQTTNFVLGQQKLKSINFRPTDFCCPAQNLCRPTEF